MTAAIQSPHRCGRAARVEWRADRLVVIWWRSKDKLRGERNSGVDGVCDEAMSFDAVHGFAGRLEFDSAPEHDPGSDRDFSEAIFPSTFSSRPSASLSYLTGSDLVRA